MTRLDGTDLRLLQSAYLTAIADERRTFYVAGVKVDPRFPFRVEVAHGLNFRLTIIMNWQPLKVLLKAPRKKYIRKLLEYSIMVMHCHQAVPQHATTPIAQQFPQDLQLNSEEAHLLIGRLISLVKWCQAIDFDPQPIRNSLAPYLEQQLADIVVDLLQRMKDDINICSNTLVSQAYKLVSFDWQLDMEVATDKGKTNTPMVELQLTTAKDSQVSTTTINMKGTEFDVFFSNLQKIKEQLAQLVQAEE